MRGVAVACVAVFCLSGCQSSGSPAQAVATPDSVPIPAVALSQPEPRDTQKLNQPPAPRAKDLAPPDPFVTQPSVGDHASRGAVVAHPRLPQPGYPLARPATGSRRPVWEPEPRAAAAAPQAVLRPAPVVVSPAPSSAVAAPLAGASIPPALPRFAPPNAGAPPARPVPASMRQPPRLPGQAAPPPFSTPLGERRAKEKELEQAYLQSRADALNLKYHGGRAVLSPNSPQVTTSAIAPPAPNMPPSIPGTYGVVDAFKASEVKRQEWQSYRNQPPVGVPVTPQLPPQPAIPQPQAPRPSFPLR